MTKPAAEDPPEVLAPVEARQGFLGRPVLIVLVVSVVLAVAAMLFGGMINVR